MDKRLSIALYVAGGILWFSLGGWWELAGTVLLALAVYEGLELLSKKED